MMKINKLSIVFLVGGLVVGYLIHSFLAPHSYKEITPAQIENEKIDRAHDWLFEIYQTDIQEYKKLKSMEEKYQTANDILSKIMVVFLAELSLRVTKEDIGASFAHVGESDKSEFDSQSSTRCREAPTSKSCPSLQEMASERGMKVVPQNFTVTPPAKEKKWVQNEDKLSEVRSEQEAQEFLDSVLIEDFFEEVRSAKNAKWSFVKSLGGQYQGILNYDDPEQSPADISIKFSELEKTTDGISAHYEISLSRDGINFSSSSGDGNFQTIKFSESSKSSFFLDLGGKTGFLQLYFLGASGSLIGNYYRQTDISKFKKEGMARIEKRH